MSPRRTPSRRLARAVGLVLLPAGLAMTAYGSAGAARNAWPGGTGGETSTAVSEAPAASRETPALEATGVRTRDGGDDPRRGNARRTPVTDASPPTGITVPALSLKARVVPVEVSPDGVLDPPADVSQVGWWQRSAPLGAASGQTVLTGHSVHTGGGVMDDLEQLGTGDLVRVFSDGALARYRVTDVEVWSKEELAERALEIFGQDRDPDRLVLVTCEGWNGRDWESNVVVTADPA